MMKVCVVQPMYSFNFEDAEKCFQHIISLLDQCDSSLDLIVLPECCDVPVPPRSNEEFLELMKKYNKIILKKAADTAIRCGALVFVNCTFEVEQSYRNTTYAIDENGEIIGKYFKTHPTPGEITRRNSHYSDHFSEPYVLEHNGVRYGFMTCYDFYFYEGYAALARKGVDVIVGASHQRTDTHLALDIIGKFLSYHTDAYLVRSSVSLGEDSPIGGSSMVVAPTGEMLLNMESRTGLGIAEIDPHKKYLKPAGFKGKMKAHHEYMEDGRRPWLYRNAGSKVVQNDASMPYPRVCAHRGFSNALPENTLPAYGAAVALGAQEIEFDLYETKDGILVSMHDCTLERVSNGTGKVWEYTLEELRRFDFGSNFSEDFRGLKIPTFEEILHRFAATTVMNIHVKPYEGRDDVAVAEKLVSLLNKYDCKDHAYIMSGDDRFLKTIYTVDPKMRRCVGAEGDAWGIVDRAIEMKCEKVQLFKPFFNKEMVDKANANGIVCNVFFADDPEEAIKYLDMGIDTILTNNFLAVSQAVDQYVAGGK